MAARIVPRRRIDMEHGRNRAVTAERSSSAGRHGTCEEPLRGDPTMRTTTLIAGIVTLTAALGCENSAREQQQKVDQAQAEADQKVAEAQREANEKSAQARADADKKMAEAQETFTKTREDYRHDVTTKLAELDKKIADLDAKAKTLKPPKRAEMDAKLDDIHKTRDAFVADYRQIETASATTWDGLKKRLDKSWTDLEAKVDKA
ncbi:MAG TPA: hypothetical protein VFV94_18255 [Polyangiaceae bacterium]|nr:hypothetical protein [Polyangiaceae bacterium]